MRSLIVLCALWLLMLAMATKPITLTVDPRIGMAPHDLHVRLHILRAPENRMIMWACEGENLSTASEIPVEGENSPAAFERWITRAPAGEYECRAALIRQGFAPIYAPPVHVELMAP
jgi:hypothetical protein